MDATRYAHAVSLLCSTTASCTTTTLHTITMYPLQGDPVYVYRYHVLHAYYYVLLLYSLSSAVHGMVASILASAHPTVHGTTSRNELCAWMVVMVCTLCRYVGMYILLLLHVHHVHTLHYYGMEYVGTMMYYVLHALHKHPGSVQ